MKIRYFHFLTQTPPSIEKVLILDLIGDKDLPIHKKLRSTASLFSWPSGVHNREVPPYCTNFFPLSQSSSEPSYCHLCIMEVGILCPEDSGLLKFEVVSVVGAGGGEEEEEINEALQQASLPEANVRTYMYSHVGDKKQKNKKNKK